LRGRRNDGQVRTSGTYMYNKYLAVVDSYVYWAGTLLGAEYRVSEVVDRSETRPLGTYRLSTRTTPLSSHETQHLSHLLNVQPNGKGAQWSKLVGTPRG